MTKGIYSLRGGPVCYIDQSERHELLQSDMIDTVIYVKGGCQLTRNASKLYYIQLADNSIKLNKSKYGSVYVHRRRARVFLYHLIRDVSEAFEI